MYLHLIVHCKVKKSSSSHMRQFFHGIAIISLFIIFLTTSHNTHKLKFCRLRSYFSWEGIHCGYCADRPPQHRNLDSDFVEIAENISASIMLHETSWYSQKIQNEYDTRFFCRLTTRVHIWKAVVYTLVNLTIGSVDELSYNITRILKSTLNGYTYASQYNISWITYGQEDKAADTWTISVAWLHTARLLSATVCDTTAEALTLSMKAWSPTHKTAILLAHGRKTTTPFTMFVASPESWQHGKWSSSLAALSESFTSTANLAQLVLTAILIFWNNAVQWVHLWWKK